LLIGAPLDGLAGVRNDIDAMAGVLGKRGFAVERCVGAEATRAGVLAAYELLIADTDAGDAVVVYYSGHGGLARSSDGDEVLQFLAPVDYYATRPGDFRGIASAELSALLARLTELTANATVILDCCHAARMSRDASLRVRSLPELASYEAVRAHVDRLRQTGRLGPEQLRSAGNPRAVRVVACATGESAYEYRGRAGPRIGMLTEALVEAFAEAGDARITWAAVMDRVRRRVLALESTQRPEVEGPSRRFVFEIAEDDAVSALRVAPIGAGRARMENAALFGVGVGDEFAVVSDAPIGRLTVDEVGPRYAEGPLTLRVGRDAVPIGARAVRTKASVPEFPVLVPTADLGEAVDATPTLRVAGPEERWLATVLVGAHGELTVADRLGPLHRPRAAGPGAVGAVLRDLRALAQASALRQSAVVAGTDWRLDAEVSIDWGTVRRGARRRLPTSGAAVHVGEYVYIEVRNNDSRELFVSLVDIGVSGRITVLTQHSPSGAAVVPGSRFVFNEPLGWPDGLDPAVPRPETVLVLVSASPRDVSVLEQEGVRDDRRLAVVEEPTAGPADGCDIHVIEFELGSVRQ
jgi:hypothetical protein